MLTKAAKRERFIDDFCRQTAKTIRVEMCNRSASYKEIAKRMGIKETTLRGYLRDGRRLSSSIIGRIAFALQFNDTWPCRFRLVEDKGT